MFSPNWLCPRSESGKVRSPQSLWGRIKDLNAFLDSVHAKTIIQSKKGGKNYFHEIGYALGQNLAKFEALKASEAESKTSMLFLDSVHAKTIIQSKKGGKKYFHQIGYALGQNLAKFEALKACEAESKTSIFSPNWVCPRPDSDQGHSQFGENIFCPLFCFGWWF